MGIIIPTTDSNEAVIQNVMQLKSFYHMNTRKRDQIRIPHNWTCLEIQNINVEVMTMEVGNIR